MEDLQYRQKLLRYVVSGTSFSESIRNSCLLRTLQGLGIMTDAEFEKVAEIQARLTDIQIRHQFETDDRKIREMKLDARA